MAIKVSGTTVIDNSRNLTNILAATVDDLTITGSIDEAHYSHTAGSNIALNPANGTIQTYTANQSVTFTDSFSEGESMTFMINGANAAYTITWPTISWVGGSAPDISITGYSLVTLWKVGATLYGAYGGDF